MKWKFITDLIFILGAGDNKQVITGIIHIFILTIHAAYKVRCHAQMINADDLLFMKWISSFV